MLTLAIDDSSDDPEYRRALRSARLFMTVTWVRPHGQAAAGPRAAQLHAEGHSLAAANSPSARRRRCRSRRSRRAQGAAVAHRVARLADCDPGGVAAGLPAPHIPHGRGGPRARPAPPPRDQAQPRRGRAAASQAALRQSSMRRARRQRCCPLRRSAATLKPRPAPRMHRAIGFAALPSPASQPPAGSLSLHFALNTPFPFPWHPLHLPLTPPSAARAAAGRGEEARRPTLR